MKKYFKILSLSLLLMVFAGCEDFLDINDDPNSPLEVRVTQLLPAIEERLFAALGMTGLSNTSSFLMQYNVTRGNLNDYNIAANTAAGVWNVLYQDCLTDIREMNRIAAANGYTAYVGIGKIMQGFIFSILVDYWGDVPFTDANKGSANPKPTFDKDSDVYASALALINEGLAELDKPVTFAIRNDDRVYAGDLAKWRRFANTVKLKMYNQMRLDRNVSAEVTALINGGNLITNITDDFQLAYGTSTNPDNRNPAYAGQYAPGTKTSPNPYFWEVLKGTDTFGHGGNIFSAQDPRIPYYVYKQLGPTEAAQNPTAYKDGGFVSLFSFSFNIDPNEGFDQSASAAVMGLYPIGGRYDNDAVDANGRATKANNNGYAITPQRVLTSFQTDFIIAELCQAGVYAGNAGTYLQSAIDKAFAKVNQVATAAAAPTISNGARDTYKAAVMDVFNNSVNVSPLQVIMTQKWISSYGYAVDAFTDYRRTGFPILHDGNTDNRATTVRTRDYVVSIVYPDNEVLLNPNAPAQRNPYLSKVFWDK
jgi:hypothetical protein